MVSLWLMCMLTVFSITRITGMLDGAVSDDSFGLQLPANNTGCSGDPHGDRLKELCDSEAGITCCLYTAGPDLCLEIVGGDDKFLRTLLPQIPSDHITYMVLYFTDFSDQQGDTLCILSNLHTLLLIRTDLEVFTCLPQLRVLFVESETFRITNATFQGLNSHVSQVIISCGQLGLSVPAHGVMQLQDVKELSLILLKGTDSTELDVWPLCLAQTHPGIYVSLAMNPIVEFTNTFNPALCNIDTHLLPNTEIDLSFNAITHVSDIATGWEFSSVHHFITSLMRDNSSHFPIRLYGNPFICDCKDKDLYQILRDPRYRIHLTNLVNLTCDRPSNLKDRRFETLLDSELDCDSPPLRLILGLSIGGIGGTVLLAVSILGLLFYNRIRLYRWSGHKLHPWDRDECIGENKEFDVFVSHASEDEAWTLELMEQLERRGFKVLFHKRDFEVGVTKIENIMMAVDKSKRTICVLSPSFAASAWCSWEFLTVFNDDIEEHQRRLLVVVKERVAWECLSLAMQRYMRDFTYIDAESPYFMDNLLYSLPVTRLGEDRLAEETGSVDKNCQPATSDLNAGPGHSIAGERTPLLQTG